MSQRVLAEAVSQIVDADENRDKEYLALVADHRSELQPLLDVIRLLKAVLVPVEPSPAFVAALRARLATIPLEELPSAAPPYPRGLVWGSLAFGSLVSAAAVYLLVARTRAARAA